MSMGIIESGEYNKVAGGGVLPVVRKPVWSRAISITLAQLKAGYAAPEDGVFIGYVNPLTPTSTYIPVTINGLEVGLCATWQTARSYLNLTCQVNQGDVIQCANINTADSISLSFIPFEDSTIAEPEVVTPEYIRNQNILSDWEDITVPAAGFTAPYDGFVSISNSVATGKTGLAAILVNGVSCNSWRILPTDTTVGANTLACSAPIKKGDVVTVIGVDIGATKARYYKLRDYRGR